MVIRGKGARPVLLHAILVCGAAIFMLPLVWMLSTSFKVPREMGIESLQFFPRVPRPQSASPYIDTTQFDEPLAPDQIPEETWSTAKPLIEQSFSDAMLAWNPQNTGPLNIEQLRAEMLQGFMQQFRLRLTDEARAAAQDEAGSGIIVAEARQMLDHEMLNALFDDCYRRFALGDLSVRTQDYLTYSISDTGTWSVLDGPAVLPGIPDNTPDSQQVLYDFAHGHNEFTLQFIADKMPAHAERVDRVYLGYRGDATWAFMQVEVIRAGVLYRTDAWMNLHERDWFTRELRFPEDATNIYERRLYRVLKPIGPAPANAAPFALNLKITRASAIEAWTAKLTRAYREAFREVPFGRYIMTSFSLAILNIVLAIFSCTLVGYSFARLEWPGRDLCFGVLLATMMIPPQVTMIPQFLILKSLGWYNTLIPLWIFSAFGVPFFIFLVRQFLKNVPADLEDAARIDGCGFLRIYWHVMLPLIRPVVATIAIFTFMGTWNNFLQPLIYVNDERLFPLALGLFKLNVNSAQDVSLMMAGSFIMTLPVIALFVFLQRYFIQGISLTGTKA